MVQKKTGAKRPRKTPSKKTAKKAVRKAPRKPGKAKDAYRTRMISVVALLIGVALLVTAAIMLYQMSREPIPTTFQSALAAFQGRNVSALILNDLATDFSSGNYTLKQLAAKYPGFGADIEAVDAALRSEENEVLAEVNGYTITRADFNDQLALIPPNYRGVMSDEQILQEMINEQLIVQRAKDLGLTPTTSEIEQAYQDLLSKGNLTAQQLEQNIASYGLTKNDLREMLARQLTITKVIAQEVDAKVNVTPAEAQAFYEQNKNKFSTAGNVTVRHILIAPNATLNDTAAKALAEQVLAQYKAGTDFCTLVTEYSTDKGSVNDCGEYTFGKGVMVQPFEDAAFGMTDGETRIVKSQFGYHVMLKIGSNPGRQLTYDEVANQLLQQMRDQLRLQMYQDFIRGLHDNATIVDNLANLTEPEPQAETEATPVVETADVEPVSENASNASGVTVQTTGDITVVAPTASLADFAACLTSKGAVLYTASWDATSQHEITKFGDGADSLDVVDCAAEDATCTGVQAYPTWKIGGKLYLGTMSLDELSQRTGCALPQ